MSKSAVEPSLELPRGLKLERLNVNVLGHVDSGKTCLARALSTRFSTAALDKSTESSKRGMTLDLGFSCFEVSAAELQRDYLTEGSSLSLPFAVRSVQFTLVDCPGHSSLIRTVIGGASIMDVMVLVIDVMKGIQAQTGECIVLGQVLCQSKTRLIVALNKMDTFYAHYAEESAESIESKLQKRISVLRKTFSKTKFGKNVAIVPVSANIGGAKAPGMDLEYDRSVEDTHSTKRQSGIFDLMKQLISLSTSEPLARICREHRSDLLAAVDHCFNITGHGSVLTCTVIRGHVSIGDNIQILPTEAVKRVKSLQVFSKPVPRAIAGDRVAVSISQFKCKSFERGFMCRPDSVRSVQRAIARIDRIKFFKDAICTGDKFHVSVGHCTTVAKLTLFKKPTTGELMEHISGYNCAKPSDSAEIKMSDDILLTDAASATTTLPLTDDCPVVCGSKAKKKKKSKKHMRCVRATDWLQPFDFETEYLYLDALEHWSLHCSADECTADCCYQTYALLELSKPLYVPKGSLVIGSRLDKEALMREDKCRMAFAGTLLTTGIGKGDHRRGDESAEECKTDCKRKLERVHSSKRMVALSLLPPDIQSLYAKMQRNSIEAVLKRMGKESAAAKKKKVVTVDCGLQSVLIYKPKLKTGSVLRVTGANTLIAADLFGKGLNAPRLIERCKGLKVELHTAAVSGECKEEDSGGKQAEAASTAHCSAKTRIGTVDCCFGESGKFVVSFDGGHGLEAIDLKAAARKEAESRKRAKRKSKSKKGKRRKKSSKKFGRREILLLKSRKFVFQKFDGFVQ